MNNHTTTPKEPVLLLLSLPVEPSSEGKVCVMGSNGTLLVTYEQAPEQLAVVIETCEALYQVNSLMVQHVSDFRRLYSYPELQAIVRKYSGFDDLLVPKKSPKN